MVDFRSSIHFCRVNILFTPMSWAFFMSDVTFLQDDYACIFGQRLMETRGRMWLDLDVSFLADERYFFPQSCGYLIVEVIKKPGTAIFLHGIRYFLSVIFMYYKHFNEVFHFTVSILIVWIDCISNCFGRTFNVQVRSMIFFRLTLKWHSRRKCFYTVESL